MQARSQTGALGAIAPLRVSLHPLALCFAPSVIPVVQMMQSEALEGAMTPVEGTLQLHPLHLSGYGPDIMYCFFPHPYTNNAQLSICLSFS